MPTVVGSKYTHGEMRSHDLGDLLDQGLEISATFEGGFLAINLTWQGRLLSSDLVSCKDIFQMAMKDKLGVKE